MLQNKIILIALLLIAGLTACSKRPVLYDDAAYKDAGKDAAEEAIDACMAQAERAGSEDDGRMGKAAYNAARGATAGTATGAIAGAIHGGSVGRGIGAGAAGGAAASLVWGLFDRNPDPVFQAYVNACLKDKGFRPIGWK